MQFQLGWRLDIYNFPTIYSKFVNLSRQDKTIFLKLGLESANKMQKEKKNIVFLRVMDSIYYKKFLILLKIYVAAFVLFILQEFNNT